jgi:hypothetical protein
MLKVLLRRCVQAYVESGPKGLSVAIWQKAKQQLRSGRAGGGPHDGVTTGGAEATGRQDIPWVHPFDAEYGTDTSGLIFGETLNTGSRSDLWNTAYYGISPSGFNQIMESLGAEFGSEWGRFTFVDLGSGKGRALLLASRFPFRKIVGVELAPELSAVAAANIKLMVAPWQTCREMEANCADAATFDYPAGPMVLYLNNPFLPPVLKRCLKNLARNLEVEPREVYVVYVHPLFKREMERVPGLTQLWERSFPFSEEDQRADRVGAKREEAVLWRHIP